MRNSTTESGILQLSCKRKTTRFTKDHALCALSQLPLPRLPCVCPGFPLIHDPQSPISREVVANYSLLYRYPGWMESHAHVFVACIVLCCVCVRVCVCVQTQAQVHRQTWAHRHKATDTQTHRTPYFFLHGVLAGSDPSLKPAMLTGHLDVVPIANPDAWEVDPFEAQIHNGFVYGRGALDDKVQMLWEEGEGGGKERGWGGGWTNKGACDGGCRVQCRPTAAHVLKLRRPYDIFHDSHV